MIPSPITIHASNMLANNRSSLSNLKLSNNPGFRFPLAMGCEGIKKSAAQITKNYTKNELIGQQIIAVVNLPKKQIANIQSDFLTLGATVGQTDKVILIQPQSKVENGSSIC